MVGGGRRQHGHLAAATRLACSSGRANRCMRPHSSDVRLVRCSTALPSLHAVSTLTLSSTAAAPWAACAPLLPAWSTRCRPSSTCLVGAASCDALLHSSCRMSQQRSALYGCPSLHTPRPPDSGARRLLLSPPPPHPCHPQAWASACTPSSSCSWGRAEASSGWPPPGPPPTISGCASAGQGERRSLALRKLPALRCFQLGARRCIHSGWAARALRSACVLTFSRRAGMHAVATSHHGCRRWRLAARCERSLPSWCCSPGQPSLLQRVTAPAPPAAAAPAGGLRPSPRAPSSPSSRPPSARPLAAARHWMSCGQATRRLASCWQVGCSGCPGQCYLQAECCPCALACGARRICRGRG